MATAVTHELLAPDHSCGFCLVRLIEADDPRALACGHVFCSDCLESKADKHKSEIDCCFCKQHFIGVTLRKLRKVKVSTDEISGEIFLTAENPPCDGCKTTPTDAVKYCIDCGKKMCEDHMEIHMKMTEMQEEDHQLIPIADFQLTPGKYHVSKCIKHTKYRLVDACRDCFKTFCSRCSTREKCPKVDGDHDVCLLGELADDLRNKINTVNGKLYEKMKKCRNAEKTTWKSFNKVEEQVEAICDEIDQTVQDIISEVQAEAYKVKEQFRSYLNEKSDDVFNFSEDRLTTIAGLDHLFMSAQSLSKQSADVEVLSGYHEKITQIREAIDDKSTESSLSQGEIRLVKENWNFELGLKFPIPDSLILLRSEKTDDICYGVLTDGERILCATSGGIENRDTQLRMIKKIPVNSLVASVCSAAGKLVSRMVSGDDDIHSLYLGTEETPLEQLIYGYVDKTDGGLYWTKKLATSDTRIAFVDHVNKKLKLFTLTGSHLHDIELEDVSAPTGVCILNEETYFVCDFEGNKVVRFDVSHSPEDGWTQHSSTLATNIDSPAGISLCEESQLLYVCMSCMSVNETRVAVIRLDGTLVREIPVQVAHIEDVAVKGNRVLMACLDGGVKLFSKDFSTS